MHHDDIEIPAPGPDPRLRTVRGIRIPVEGDWQLVDLDAGEDTLRDLVEQIGCQPISAVELSPGIDMWIAGDCQLVGNPQINRRATAVADSFQDGDSARLRQPYRRTAVILGHDMTGDIVSLSERTLAWIQQALERFDEALNPTLAQQDEDGIERNTKGGGMSPKEIS